jgi:hypothetical protein
MLTATEKRFIKSWEDQRQGGRMKYFLLYILAGTFVGTLVLSFLTLMLNLGFPDNLWLIAIGSFCIVTIFTVLTWNANEKKFKSIIQREIREGIEKDAGSGK